MYARPLNKHNIVPSSDALQLSVPTRFAKIPTHGLEDHQPHSKHTYTLKHTCTFCFYILVHFAYVARSTTERRFELQSPFTHQLCTLTFHTVSLLGSISSLARALLKQRARVGYHRSTTTTPFELSFPTFEIEHMIPIQHQTKHSALVVTAPQ